MKLMMRATPARKNRQSGFTLVELFVAMAILALVLVAFSSGFAVLQDRQSTSGARTDLRTHASSALEEIARELADSAPGYVDTTQRSPARPLSGAPFGTATDVFEDTLGGDPLHPKRQCLNCANPGGLVQTCRGLSPTGTTKADLAVSSLKDSPGKWLGPTTSPAASLPGFQGLALTRQMAPGTVCPFCGSSLTTNLAYTDVLLFLAPRDLDHGGWTPALTPDATKAVWSGVVVYAPWIDDQGVGSLRRYTLPYAPIVADATANPGSVTLPKLLDPDGDGILFQWASPQTYDLGNMSSNVFALDHSASVPLNPNRPSIVWQKGLLTDPEHVVLVFDRESGTAFWDIARQISPGVWFKSASPAEGLARTVRALATGPGYGCCDFAVSNAYSNAPQDPIADVRRVRLAIAVGRSWASGIREKDPLVALAALDVCVRNAP